MGLFNNWYVMINKICKAGLSNKTDDLATFSYPLVQSAASGITKGGSVAILTYHGRISGKTFVEFDKVYKNFILNICV